MTNAVKVWASGMALGLVNCQGRCVCTCWANPRCSKKAMKLASPPKGVIALDVSAKTSLASPNSAVILAGVVLCKVGPGCLSINPYAHKPSHQATLFRFRSSG